MIITWDIASKSEAPCVLLICDRPVPATEIVCLARAMKEDGRLWPVVVLSSPFVEIHSPTKMFDGLDIVRLYDPDPGSVLPRGSQRGEQGHSHTPALIAGEISKRPLRQALAKARAVGEKLRFMFAWDLICWRRSLRAEVLVARRICAELEPVAMVVTDDRAVRDFPGFLFVAQEREIFSLLLPYAMSDPDADMLRREDRSLFHIDYPPQRRAKRRLAEKFPNQIRPHPELGRMSFHTPAQTFALSEIDMLADPSWTPGGGVTDVIAVFGAEDRDRYVALGVREEKIAITGQCSLDGLWKAARDRDALREKLRGEYGLGVDAPIVICAVPNLGEHRMISWKEHWAAIDELFSQLAETTAETVLSLHPRADRSNYEHRAAQAGLAISNEPMSVILPAADVFVAAMSSTVRWAAMVGVPTVIDDGYGLGYEYFHKIPGVQVCEDRTELGGAVRQLLEDAELRKDKARQAKEYAAIMGPSDGRASTKIIGTIFDRSSRACPYETKSRLK